MKSKYLTQRLVPELLIFPRHVRSPQWWTLPNQPLLKYLSTRGSQVRPNIEILSLNLSNGARRYSNLGDPRLSRVYHSLYGRGVHLLFFLLSSKFQLTWINHFTNLTKGWSTETSRTFLITRTVRGGLYQVNLWLAGSWIVLGIKVTIDKIRNSLIQRISNISILIGFTWRKSINLKSIGKK